MSRPRNTRDEIIPIPALHGFHIPGAIEEQEAQGAAAMQPGDCETIPTEISGGSEADLVALGFVLGPIDSGDPTSRRATLPPGWKRSDIRLPMYTFIVDGQGRKRVSLFYKAAGRDRPDKLSITTVYDYVEHCLRTEAAPVLDDAWATREAVVTALELMAKRAKQSAAEWAGHAFEPDMARIWIAKVKVLRLALTAGDAR